MRVISEMFAGGYNSVYEQAWNDGLEQFIYYYYDEYDIEISENEIINKKYQEYLTDCANRWLDVCTDDKISYGNVEVISPREYNFETDKVGFDVPLTELNLMRVQVKLDSNLLERFNKICDERFKEHSDYIPFYKAPNLDKNCYLWNRFQLGALFDAYFYDAFEEYREDCQDYDDAVEVLNNNDYWDCNNKEYINL